MCGMDSPPAARPQRERSSWRAAPVLPHRTREQVVAGRSLRVRARRCRHGKRRAAPHGAHRLSGTRSSQSRHFSVALRREDCEKQSTASPRKAKSTICDVLTGALGSGFHRKCALPVRRERGFAGRGSEERRAGGEAHGVSGGEDRAVCTPRSAPPDPTGSLGAADAGLVAAGWERRPRCPKRGL